MTVAGGGSAGGRAVRFALAIALLVPAYGHLARYGTDSAAQVVSITAFGLVLGRVLPRAGLAVAATFAFAVPLIPSIFETFPFLSERALVLGALAGRLTRPEPFLCQPAAAASLGVLRLTRFVFGGLAAAVAASALASLLRELPLAATWGAREALVAFAGDLLTQRSLLDPTHGLSVGWLRLEGLWLAWWILEDAVRPAPDPGSKPHARSALFTVSRAVAIALLLGFVVAGLDIWRGLEFRNQPFLEWAGRGFPRNHRPLTDNNALGSALVLLLPMTAGVLFSSRARRGLGWLALISMPAALALLVSSRSKAGLAAFAFSVPVFVALAMGFTRRERRPLALLVGGLGLALAVTVQLLPDRVFEPLQRAKHGADLVRALRLEAATDYLAEYRASPWSGARSMVTEHPWIGVGLGRFPRELGQHRDRSLEVPFAPDHENAHSQPLQIAAELGGLGVLLEGLLFGGALLGALRAAGRRDGEPVLAAGLAAGLAALALNLTVGHSLLEATPAYLFAVACGLGLAELVGLAGSRSLEWLGTGPPRPAALVLPVLFALYLMPGFREPRRALAEASLGAYPWIERESTVSGSDRMIGSNAWFAVPFEHGNRIIVPVLDVRPWLLPGDQRARLAIGDGPFGPWVNLPRDSNGQRGEHAYLKGQRPPALAPGELVELHLEVEPVTAPSLWFDSGRNPVGARVSRPGFAGR